MISEMLCSMKAQPHTIGIHVLMGKKESRHSLSANNKHLTLISLSALKGQIQCTASSYTAHKLDVVVFFYIVLMLEGEEYYLVTCGNEMKFICQSW